MYSDSSSAYGYSYGSEDYSYESNDNVYYQRANANYAAKKQRCRQVDRKQREERKQRIYDRIVDIKSGPELSGTKDLHLTQKKTQDAVQIFEKYGLNAKVVPIERGHPSFPGYSKGWGISWSKR